MHVQSVTFTGSDVATDEKKVRLILGLLGVSLLQKAVVQDAIIGLAKALSAHPLTVKPAGKDGSYFTIILGDDE